jgi:hypothetical protein
MVRKKYMIAIGIILLLTVMSVNVFADDVFTDVDSYTSFTNGGNPVFPDGAAGNDAADVWIGNWNNADQKTTEWITIEDGKGWDGTKAFANWSVLPDETATSPSNTGVFIFATPGNGIPTSYTGTQYLRLWADFTEVKFRKISVGVSDGDYNWYATDANDSNAGDIPFYYLPEGSTEWQTFYIGEGDGCFGEAEGSDTSGLKGFFAFPISTLVLSDDGSSVGMKTLFDKGTPATPDKITSVYVFWDYSDAATEVYGTKFYLDNFEFLADYKTFNSVIYNPPIIEEEAPAEAAVDAPAAEAPVSQAPPVQTVSPQTGDMAIVYVILLVTAAFIFTVTAKKRKA